MGISIDVTHDTWGVDNLDWLAARKGFDTCRPVTLDLSLFTDEALGIVDVQGLIPSGIVIARVTATGMYGPYDPGGNDPAGTNVAAGHVLHGTRVRDSEGNPFTRAAVAMLWEGIVLLDKLPSFSGSKGEIDQNGQDALNNFIRYE